MRPLQLLLTSLLLGSGAAQATLFQTLTLAQQARKADVIVQATILTPTLATEGGLTYAVYPLKVSETLAGDAATLPQTVGSVAGSGPALYVLSGVDSAPVFQAGQEAVLLLYKGRLDSPLVGYNQGAYLISGGLVSPLVSALPAGTVTGTFGAAPSAGPGQATGQTPAQGLTPSLVAGTGQPVIPTTPTASTIPGTASDASAAASNQAATRAAALNPATAAPGISTSPPGTAVPTGSPAVTATPAPSTTPGASGTTVATGGAATSNAGSTPVAPISTGTTLPGTTSTGAATATTSASSTSGVLGTIRTPAELKAAIVAARAAK